MTCWEQVNDDNLMQGDCLPECYVPIYPDDYGESPMATAVPVEVFDVIVITQSCDLVNDKIKLVAVVPFYLLAAFEEVNPSFSKKGKWDEVRKGRIQGLHILPSPSNPVLPSPSNPADGRAALVVNFRAIYSLPYGYLKKRANVIGMRWRLRSPYLERYSQAFGNSRRGGYAI